MQRRTPVPIRSAIAALGLVAVGLAVCWTGLRADPTLREAVAGRVPGTPQASWLGADGRVRPGARPVRPHDPAAVASGSVPVPAPGVSPAVPPGLPGGRAPGGGAEPGAGAPAAGRCTVGPKLVPTCGVLWGAAPGAHTERRGGTALHEFEEKTGRTQTVFHAYHRGTTGLFPTEAERALAREPGHRRILFLNWKPTGASWARIARGDRRTDRFLDRLAAHIRRTYPERFFLTVHHEPEDDVRSKPGSGYTAKDFAAMFRHVVRRLRAGGADNVVTVLVHMAYAPLTSRSWFADMYPGDDVVDWVGFDTYAYSEPGYGHGDFAELVNRRAGGRGRWPGFYNWATARYPDKPLMVAEWGVWHSDQDPAHQPRLYRSVGRQIGQFPRIRALVHFDTPADQRGLDSRVDASEAALTAYQRLGALPIFQVDLTPAH